MYPILGVQIVGSEGQMVWKVKILRGKLQWYHLIGGVFLVSSSRLRVASNFVNGVCGAGEIH